MKLLLLLAFLLASSHICKVEGEEQECSSYLTIHEIMSVEGGVMTIDDESGMREIKASSFNIGACPSSKNYASGSKFTGNYSLLGLSSPLGSGNCVAKSITGNSVMESMQAVVIRANGWLLEPQTIDMDDIDSQVNVPVHEAWMESAACFGVVSGEVVLPKTRISANTLLTLKEFLIPKDAMRAMGLSVGEWIVPGAEFAGTELFNCPFASTSPESARCRMTISFEIPVDTLVFLYGLRQQSYTETESAMFISQIDMKCGCRCVSGSAGSREVALPLKGLEGQCSQVHTSAPRTECDILGKKWCSMDTSFAYKINGEQLPNGNFPCRAETSYMSRVLSDFNPTDKFVPAI